MSPPLDPASGGGPTRPLRIAMALYGDVTNDSRVLREAQTLAQAGHHVTVCCLSGRAPADARFRIAAWTPDRTSIQPDGTSPFASRERSSALRRSARKVRWLAGYGRNLDAWGRWAIKAGGDVDVWHAHDLTGLLAVGRHIGPDQRLIYDSHEIYLQSGSAARLPRIVRRILGVVEGRLTRRAVALVTVNEAYGAVLGRLRPRRTVIVRNCPPRWFPTHESQGLLRTALGIGETDPIALYHGVFARHRGIEQVSEALLEIGMSSVHLALLGFGELRPDLERLATDPRFEGRIHVLDAVSPDELLAWVSGADVDVIALEDSSLNHRLCTPNKLWESIASGVPVVVSDFPVMREIVLDDPHGPLGEVCDPVDPGSIAIAIRAIVDLGSEARAELRARCHDAAETRWNWEHESARLVELYASL